MFALSFAGFFFVLFLFLPCYVHKMFFWLFAINQISAGFTFHCVEMKQTFQANTDFSSFLCPVHNRKICCDCKNNIVNMSNETQIHTQISLVLRLPISRIFNYRQSGDNAVWRLFYFLCRILNCLLNELPKFCSESAKHTPCDLWTEMH